jgi:hypothetical protein
LIFGISITTYYKLPIFKESPIINVKFANSNQDLITKTNLGDSFSSDLDLSISQNGNISSSKKTLQPYKVKKLQANSVVNTEANKDQKKKTKEKENGRELENK